MKLGTTFPSGDVRVDPGCLRAFAQGVEDLGFDDLYLGDHVLGADLSVRPGWAPFSQITGKPAPPPYDTSFPWLEPMVAFGFLAECTRRLRLVSGVMVLGMRQTVLVAKQAAIADVLSGGRITLGIGAGWNDVEYGAMGVDFSTRGARIDEQISVLQQLWTKTSITYTGVFHDLLGVGINPLPVQRPIPIWIGGNSDAAMRRAARRCAAWYPGARPDAAHEEQIGRYWKVVASERPPGDAPTLVGSLHGARRDMDVVVDELLHWEKLGADRVNIRTPNWPPHFGEGAPQPITDVDNHLEVLRHVRDAWLRARPTATSAVRRPLETDRDVVDQTK
jgi:probable F420-dependent oxidoreductase